MANLLIVDDELSMRQFLTHLFQRDGHSIRVADNGRQAMVLLRQQPADVVISDVKMPDMGGIELLRAAREMQPNIEVIMMTAFANEETAHEAFLLGAFDFVHKPFDNELLKEKVARALEKISIVREKQALQDENYALIKSQRARGKLNNIIGQSDRMQAVYQMIETVAQVQSTVLITGESGTGKELVARAIHQLSMRAGAVFLPINAGAFPEPLIESELFGYVRGAFTGADRDRRGLFEDASGGTMFLDEVAEMAPHLQVRLLRVLETGEIRPVGSSETRRVDVRVITATNQDPLAAVRNGTLREDLFYRLNVFHLELPPLRERREDIPILAAYFVEKYSRDLGKQVTRFAAEAQIALMKYEYPGNVRELEHAIERAVVLAEGDTITLEDLPPTLSAGQTLLLPAGGGSATGEEQRAESSAATGPSQAARAAFDVGYPPSWSLLEVERAHIERVLADLQGNISLSARRLGISRTTLWRKLKRHGISVRRQQNGGPRLEPS